MTVAHASRRFRRLRLPSFGVALAVSLAVLVAFAVWMFVDASFRITLVFVEIDLGLLQNPGFNLSEIHSWQELGPRLLLFGSLAAIAVFATVIVFCRVFFGNRQGRTLRALFVSTGLVALWMALALWQERLESAGFYWRLRKAMPAIKRDAERLLAKWPTTDGVLPFCGPYVVREAYDPPLIVVQSNATDYSMNESPTLIQRTANGGLALSYGEGRVEYHSNGQEPVSFDEVVRENGRKMREEWRVKSCTELEPNWFFVSYEIRESELAE